MLSLLLLPGGVLSSVGSAAVVAGSCDVVWFQVVILFQAELVRVRLCSSDRKISYEIYGSCY